MPLFLPNQVIPAGLVYNVKDAAYGAKGDGVTDDTAAVAKAMLAASNAGGGKVWFPGGIFISGNQTLYANVSLIGSGIGATTIRLKPHANTDLFSAQVNLINLFAVYDAGVPGNLYNFTICDMTIDGNKAYQSGTSYPLRFYGYNFILRDLEVSNGLSGGALIDWNGGEELFSSDDMESLIDTSKFHDNNGIGLQLSGPHDSRMHNVLSFLNTSHHFHIAPNALGLLATNCHGYNNPNTAGLCSFLVEAPGCRFVNCISEGSYTCDTAFLADQCSWVGGSIFNSNPNWTNAIGLQLGQQAGQTPFVGQILQSGGVTTAVQVKYCVIDTQFSENQGGALFCANEGHNDIKANISQSVGTALKNESINASVDNYILNITGLTPDGNTGTSGGVSFCSSGSNNAFSVFDATNGQVFHVDNFGSLYFNGGINTASGIYFASSTSPASLASNGTILAQGVSAIAVAPTGAVTGVIMQQGYPGQVCMVINASAFSITMAAVGTSNVADGVSAVIAANRMMCFVYDATNSKWYHS